jgi:hypothetical protein
MASGGWNIAYLKNLLSIESFSSSGSLQAWLARRSGLSVGVRTLIAQDVEATRLEAEGGRYLRESELVHEHHAMTQAMN